MIAHNSRRAGRDARTNLEPARHAALKLGEQPRAPLGAGVQPLAPRVGIEQFGDLLD
jgi:hypothetical protein